MAARTTKIKPPPAKKAPQGKTPNGKAETKPKKPKKAKKVSKVSKDKVYRTGRGPGRPCGAGILSEELVAATLREYLGNLSESAKRLNVAIPSLHSYLAHHPHLRTIMEETRETFKDLAESSLVRGLRKGHPGLTMFALSTRARDRGYFNPDRLPPLELVFDLLGPNMAAKLRAFLANPNQLAEVQSNEPVTTDGPAGVRNVDLPNGGVSGVREPLQPTVGDDGPVPGKGP
jgi:hypothetical protein